MNTSSQVAASAPLAMKKTPTKAKFVEKPGENAATGKVSLSGRMVNGKQDQFLDASEMGMMKWMILMGKRAAKVAWLFLADDETQTKTDMVNLMQYMAFLAAFLTSICIAYMLGVPGMDWEYIANQWGCEGNHTTFDLGQKGNCDNSMSGEDIVRLHRDIVSVLSFGSTICFLLTMVHTVITMAMIQQTTGDVEAFRFKQKQVRRTSRTAPGRIAGFDPARAHTQPSPARARPRSPVLARARPRSPVLARAGDKLCSGPPPLRNRHRLLRPPRSLPLLDLQLLV